jgi:DNA-binding LacI/PurR family transcriptional regulator
MPNSGKKRTKEVGEPGASSVSLKQLAEHLGVSSATVSLVINRSPGAKSIPPATQDRVRQAARELNYRPNLMARSLRQKRSFTVGVIVPEISEGYASLVMSGIEDYLLEEGYFYLVVSHRHRLDLIEEYPLILQQRAVEGIIAVDTACSESALPTVAISSHREVPGVTNIVLDHDLAASLALKHLQELGHKSIAFIKGQDFSSDSEIRWQSLYSAAKQLGVSMDPRLQQQMKSDSSSPQVGYEVTREILLRNVPFTALFAFNDISAIGAIHALRESGRRVPEDVSVVGFDDIQSAAYQNPSLTTVHQPLREMGAMGAETLLQRISCPNKSAYPKQLVIKPKLMIRHSTTVCPS